MGRITAHIECSEYWDVGSQLLASSGVETAFLLNASPDQVQFALDHTTGIVVVRVYDPFDEKRHLGPDFEKDIVFRQQPMAFVNWLEASGFNRFKGIKRVRFALGWCEMYYNGQDYQRQQNFKMQNIADAVVKAGYGCALFGMATDKTIQWQDVEVGVWTDVLNWVRAHSEWAHVDAHEYELLRLASQHLKTYPVPYPNSMTDRNAMRQENWGKIDYNLRKDGNWHVGRISWLGGGFPYALGECGSDYKNDGAIEAWLPGFEAVYGKPQGFPSNRDVYNYLLNKNLTDIEFCEEVWKDMEWFAAQDPNCLSYAIFAINKRPEHAPFNIGSPQFAHLRTLMGKQTATVPPAPTIPSFILHPKQIKTLTANNIRQEPSELSADIGDLPTVFAPCEVSNETTPSISGRMYQWKEIKIGGLHGWIAMMSSIVIEDLPETEPLYRFTIGDTIFEVSESEKDLILSVMKAVQQVIETAEIMPP